MTRDLQVLGQLESFAKTVEPWTAMIPGEMVYTLKEDGGVFAQLLKLPGAFVEKGFFEDAVYVRVGGVTFRSVRRK